MICTTRMVLELALQQAGAVIVISGLRTKIYNWAADFP